MPPPAADPPVEKHVNDHLQQQPVFPPQENLSHNSFSAVSSGTMDGIVGQNDDVQGQGLVQEEEDNSGIAMQEEILPQVPGIGGQPVEQRRGGCSLWQIRRCHLIQCWP